MTETGDKRKALIAMSGGVDSSVAAALMVERGFDCIGVTMRLYANEDAGTGRGRTCCSLEDTNDARQVCASLGIPYYVFNFTEEFSEEVIHRFIESYKHGETPNPCIDCNRYMKHERLYERARQLGCDLLVTGHYARIERDEASGLYVLKKARNLAKDQSYVLYFLNQEQLAHTEFPLGSFSSKDEVRRLADDDGFVNAGKHDSQDICFVPDGDYASFIERTTGEHFPDGDFVDEEGNVLGRHRGLIRYTIGQRKGLGLSLKAPMYVERKDLEKNEVILTEGDGLFFQGITADRVSFISGRFPEKPFHATVKTRYKAKEAGAEIIPQPDGTLRIEFDRPERAPAAGQAVVIYDGDLVLGGGTIREAVR